MVAAQMIKLSCPQYTRFLNFAEYDTKLKFGGVANNQKWDHPYITSKWWSSLLWLILRLIHFYLWMLNHTWVPLISSPIKGSFRKKNSRFHFREQGGKMVNCEFWEIGPKPKLIKAMKGVMGRSRKTIVLYVRSGCNNKVFWDPQTWWFHMTSSHHMVYQYQGRSFWNIHIHISLCV